MEIANVPNDPYETWKSGALDPCGEVSASQQHDRFFFRFVESAKSREALCFAAESTIKDAGIGLFLRSHKDVIKKHTHLCSYASDTTTEEEMRHAGSTRDYALETAKRGSYFDAEIADGYNLGRYANMPLVLESLEEIRQLSDKRRHHEITDEDWSQVESKILEKCDAEYYETRGNCLVVRARRDIAPSKQSRELFTNYGGLRTYWIAGILEHPKRYPVKFQDIVRWFQTSTDCNWSSEQKECWLKC